jgi:hypothetical protein
MKKVISYVLIATISSFVSIFSWEYMHVLTGVDSEQTDKSVKKQSH